MSSATAIVPEKIKNSSGQQHWYGLPERQKDSVVDQVVEYTGKSFGAYRSLRLLGTTAEAASMVLKDLGYKEAKSFGHFAGLMGKGAAAMTFPRIPLVLRDMRDAIKTWGQPTGGPEGSVTRGYYDGVHKVADATATCGYALSLAMGSVPIRNMADVACFVSDITDACMESQVYSLAQRYKEKTSSPELKKRYEETGTEALLKIAKVVCSIVSGVLGLLVLALGGPVVPAAILLIIGLAGTIFAMASYFYRENCKYERVEFHKWGGVEQLHNGAQVRFN